MVSSNSKRSMTMPKWHTDECLIGIPTMPRYFSSLAGCIISKATVSAVKRMRLNTWRNLSVPVRKKKKNDQSHNARANTWQIKAMHKVGICLDDVTCHSRSIQKRTRPINKRFIETAGTRHSGARLAFCITRLISTEMHWMHIPVRYA